MKNSWSRNACWERWYANLHTHPMLTRQMIEDAINEYSDLSGSNLAGEIEKVKFTPVPLSLDELSKLWSVLFQTPHALSIVYQASVLLIDAGKHPGPPNSFASLGCMEYLSEIQ